MNPHTILALPAVTTFISVPNCKCPRIVMSLSIERDVATKLTGYNRYRYKFCHAFMLSVVETQYLYTRIAFYSYWLIRSLLDGFYSLSFVYIKIYLRLT